MSKKVIASAVGIAALAICARVWPDDKQQFAAVAFMVALYLCYLGLEAYVGSEPENAHRIMILEGDEPIEPKKPVDERCRYCDTGVLTRGRCESCGAHQKSKGWRQPLPSEE